jgi:hypothetical protein
MTVELKPFEIVVQCEIARFPSAVDIERMAAAIEESRGTHHEIVRGTVVPPAVYRDRRYILDGRFLVWAADSAAASASVENLLRAAGITCRSAIPSGRALSAADVPQPRAAKPSAPARTAAPRRGTARGARPAKARPPKNAPKATRRPAPKARTAKKTPKRRAR